MSARRHLGEILSAFEFLDRQALVMTLEQLPNVQDPLPGTKARTSSLNPAATLCTASFHCKQSVQTPVPGFRTTSECQAS